jgi:hypothetical protein
LFAAVAYHFKCRKNTRRPRSDNDNIFFHIVPPFEHLYILTYLSIYHTCVLYQGMSTFVKPVP